MGGLIAGEKVEMMLGTEQGGDDDDVCVTYPDFDFLKFEISRFKSQGWRGWRRCRRRRVMRARSKKHNTVAKTATQNDRLKVASWSTVA